MNRPILGMRIRIKSKTTVASKKFIKIHSDSRFMNPYKIAIFGRTQALAMYQKEIIDPKIKEHTFLQWVKPIIEIGRILCGQCPKYQDCIGEMLMRNIMKFLQKDSYEYYYG